MFCIFAIVANYSIILALTLAGIGALDSLVKDFSPEFLALLFAAAIGGYTFIGGLGATIYVSYCNTAIICALNVMLVVEVYYNPMNNPDNPFGSAAALYQFVDCWSGGGASSPEKVVEEEEATSNGDYLTFFNTGSLMFGVINIAFNLGTNLCDQSFWQLSVATRPSSLVWGFIFGSLSWASMPLTLATTAGLAYLGLSSAQVTT